MLQNRTFRSAIALFSSHAKVTSVFQTASPRSRFCCRKNQGWSVKTAASPLTIGRRTITRKMSDPAIKVLITHPEVPKVAIDKLSSVGLDLIVVESLPPKREEILAKIKGVDAALWAGHERLDAEMLDAAGPQLRVISTLSAGYDFVDIPALQARGIKLGNTPTVLNEAVAELAVGLLIAAARRFHEGRAKIESNSWENYRFNWLLGQDIRGSTVGLYGFGGIGQAIVARLKGFDIGEILYTTRTRLAEEIEQELGACQVPFDELLARSDHIIIAAPLTEQTKGVFNATAFNKMKRSAVLVNIARGPIVNQTDLYEALKNNRIFAAGLDVMTPEPLPVDDALLQLPNCVVIPHLGSATARTRDDMATIAAFNIIQALDGQPMFAPVLPAPPKCSPSA